MKKLFRVRTKVVGLIPCLVFTVACGGGGGVASPAAPSPSSTTSTATFAGKVTNIVTGANVVGATVTIGTSSATTNAEGTYSLSVTGFNQQSFSIIATGYHKRESAVSMAGSKTINSEIIPQGDGFDLAFFDQVFRNKGRNGTERWIIQPTFEIWIQQFKCLELSADPHNACVRMQATAVPTPPIFETLARASIAKVGDLTGNKLTGGLITTKTHSPDTVLSTGGTNTGLGTTANVISISMLRHGLYDSNSAEASGLIASRRVHLIYGAVVYEDLGIHIHEVAHALGFHHPDGSNNMLKPSIMGPWPYQLLDADKINGKILYLRPVGSLTPDKDPPETTIN